MSRLILPALYTKVHRWESGSERSFHLHDPATGTTWSEYGTGLKGFHKLQRLALHMFGPKGFACTVSYTVVRLLEESERIQHTETVYTFKLVC